MPEGNVRVRMGQHIDERTAALLDERQRKSSVELSWMYGSAWLGTGWGLVVLSTAVSGREFWAHHLRLGLELSGIGAGMIGALLLLLAISLVVRSGAVRLWSHLRTRRGSGRQPSQSQVPAAMPPPSTG